MIMRHFEKILTAGAAFAAIAVIGMSIGSSSVHAADEFNQSQDEKQMIQTGLAIAASSGIRLTIANNDPDMVGLGSYLVNVVADCNGCHSNPPTSFAAPGNPYLLQGANPPFFSGTKQINPSTYLGGNQDFGSFGPGPKAEIISRNLTPDKSGLPVGGDTLLNFIQIMRTGVDMDHVHPSCSATITTNCLAFPFNGDLLQVMPWPAFQRMTDRQLTAIYQYLSAIPCLEGGPGEPANRCS
ncbi:MAG: hypothetical protein M3Z09_00540 [Acidobacteriota bacterium]|nr:hypothetical protein [Acidobacteriota bacterium]